MNVRLSSRSAVNAFALIGIGAFFALGNAQTPSTPGDPLIAGFKSTYAASVSDAVELVTGKNGTMGYDMKLMTGTNLVGRAVTAIAKPAPADQATAMLKQPQAIDERESGMYPFVRQYKSLQEAIKRFNCI
jgi:hypothetical protein